jgi:hypothetical protein
MALDARERQIGPRDPVKEGAFFRFTPARRAMRARVCRGARLAQRAPWLNLPPASSERIAKVEPDCARPSGPSASSCRPDLDELFFPGYASCHAECRSPPALRDVVGSAVSASRRPIRTTDAHQCGHVCIASRKQACADPQATRPQVVQLRRLLAARSDGRSTKRKREEGGPRPQGSAADRGG